MKKKKQLKKKKKKKKNDDTVVRGDLLRPPIQHLTPAALKTNIA